MRCDEKSMRCDENRFILLCGGEKFGKSELSKSKLRHAPVSRRNVCLFWNRVRILLHVHAHFRQSLPQRNLPSSFQLAIFVEICLQGNRLYVLRRNCPQKELICDSSSKTNVAEVAMLLIR